MDGSLYPLQIARVKTPFAHSHTNHTRQIPKPSPPWWVETVVAMAACMALLSPPPKPSLSSSYSLFFSIRVARASSLRRAQPLSSRLKRLSVSASGRALDALIFDCDGVILESEHLHRQAYNDAFSHFNVRCPSSPSSEPLNWGVEFYDDLQNRIGGGKPKMRWSLSLFFPSI